MPIDFTHGLSYVLEDAGVTVVLGGVSTSGIVDQEDVLQSDEHGQVQVRETVVRVKTGSLGAGLVIDATVIADGTSYKVREIALDPQDAAMQRIVVAEVNP